MTSFAAVPIPSRKASEADFVDSVATTDIPARLRRAWLAVPGGLGELILCPIELRPHAFVILSTSQVPGHSTQQLDHDPVPLWEHLLTRYRERIVALVEAEKTAVIGAGFIPEYVWLATGGLSGVNDRVDILKNRKILFSADVDVYDYWKEKFKARP